MNLLTRRQEHTGYQVGAVVLVALAILGGISLFPDVARYIRIKTM